MLRQVSCFLNHGLHGFGTDHTVPTTRPRDKRIWSGRVGTVKSDRLSVYEVRGSKITQSLKTIFISE